MDVATLGTYKREVLRGLPVDRRGRRRIDVSEVRMLPRSRIDADDFERAHRAAVAGDQLGFGALAGHDQRRVAADLGLDHGGWLAAGGGNPVKAFPRTIRSKQIQRTTVRCEGEDRDLTIKVTRHHGSVATRGPRYATQPRQVPDFIVLRGVLEEERLAIRSELRRIVFPGQWREDFGLCAACGAHAIEMKTDMPRRSVPMLDRRIEHHLFAIEAPGGTQRRAGARLIGHAPEPGSVCER